MAWQELQAAAVLQQWAALLCVSLADWLQLVVCLSNKGSVHVNSCWGGAPCHGGACHLLLFCRAPPCCLWCAAASTQIPWQLSPGRVLLQLLERRSLPCLRLQLTLRPVLRRCFDTDTTAAVPQAVFEKNLQTLQDLSANPKSPVTYSSYERLATDKIKHRRGQYEAPSTYNMPVTTQQVTLHGPSNDVRPGLTPLMNLTQLGGGGCVMCHTVHGPLAALQDVGWHCLKTLANGSDAYFPCHKTGEAWLLEDTSCRSVASAASPPACCRCHHQGGEVHLGLCANGLAILQQ